jgi:hydroxymethylglutaryl-CoA lyase
VPPAEAEQKVRAAFEAGCRRLDCALGGLGGCPFASDRLVGNLPTERALSALSSLGLECPPAPGALAVPLLMNQEIAHRYGSQEK